MVTNDWAARDWILIPGTLCTDEVFAGFLDELGIPPARRHGIVPQYPAVEDYRSLADQSRDKIVCGFSLGALVIAHQADMLDAARLVLFGINPLPDPPDRAAGRLALAEDVQTKGGASALADRLPPFHGPRPGPVRATVLEMADTTAQHIDAQTQLALSRPGATQALRAARSPVQVLTGSEDIVMPPWQGQQAAEAAPFGQFQKLDGLGHYALLEDPAACARAFRGMVPAFAPPA